MNIPRIRFHRSPLVAKLVLIFLISLLSSSQAQNLPPALMVEENNRSTPLAISKVDVDVRVL